MTTQVYGCFSLSCQLRGIKENLTQKGFDDVLSTFIFKFDKISCYLVFLTNLSASSPSLPCLESQLELNLKFQTKFKFPKESELALHG